MKDQVNRWAALTVIGLASVLGGVALLAFVVFLFRGPFALVNLGLGESGALALDAGLCVAFFVQHGVMVRRPFRRRLARLIPGCYVDAVYAIASGVVLLTLLVLWQTSAQTCMVAEGPTRWVLRGVFFSAAAGVVWGLKALGSLDAFGVDAIRNRLRGTRRPHGTLVIRGPHRSRCMMLLMEELPDPYGEAVMLAELGTHSQAELSQKLGISVSGMKSRVQRGRDRLKKLLQACCEIEQDARGGIVGFMPRSASLREKCDCEDPPTGA